MMWQWFKNFFKTYIHSSASTRLAVSLPKKIMKLIACLFPILLCSCAEPNIVHWPATAETVRATTPISTQVVVTAKPSHMEKYTQVSNDKLDCFPTVLPPVIEVETVMPEMVYFCTKFDVNNALRCLNWEKAYKALICRGELCKTWTQKETASGPVTFSIKQE